MLNLGIIHRSDPAYASPIVLVRKKDGTNRLCFDYRKLNKVTLFDSQPMTNTTDVLEKLSDDQFFSTIDLTKGYWQIPVVADDVYKTAFVTNEGAYEFLKMPFGMINSSATFVRAMGELLHDLKNIDFYIDDVIVHTTTWTEHSSVLKGLLQRFANVGATIRPSKCVFGSNEVDIVGRNVGVGLVGLHEDNVIKIKNAQRPRTKKEVRSFLGLPGYYRDYILHYAEIASPLSDLTKRGKPNKIDWEETHGYAFNLLKSSLLCKPILRLPDVTKPFVLRTDAFGVVLGAVLLQKYDGQLIPVSFASRKPNSAERNYSTIERECLAVVWAIKKFTIYVYGVKFTLQTDH